MKHIYRFTPSWWFILPFVGVLTILVGINTLIVNLADASTGKLPFLDYITLLTLIPMMIIFGLLSCFTLLTSKIVVSPSGLEYHALLGVYVSDWQSLRSAGKVRQGNAGLATILYSIKPEIKLKRWAKWLPWNVEPGIYLRHVPVSWFGGLNGERLKLEIEAYAPHLLEKL